MKNKKKIIEKNPECQAKRKGQFKNKSSARKVQNEIRHCPRSVGAAAAGEAICPLTRDCFIRFAPSQ
jgi:hypothetical protein